MVQIYFPAGTGHPEPAEDEQPRVQILQKKPDAIPLPPKSAEHHSHVGLVGPTCPGGACVDNLVEEVWDLWCEQHDPTTDLGEYPKPRCSYLGLSPQCLPAQADEWRGPIQSSIGTPSTPCQSSRRCRTQPHQSDKRLVGLDTGAREGGSAHRSTPTPDPIR